MNSPDLTCICCLVHLGLKDLASRTEKQMDKKRKKKERKTFRHEHIYTQMLLHTHIYIHMHIHTYIFLHTHTIHAHIHKRFTQTHTHEAVDKGDTFASTCGTKKVDLLPDQETDNPG